ncbi:MAG TPA: SDR family NAD(P)-dependent oxidoreductase, partial [Planctomycetaceae bacterium]|nr:SDR family NAD(P)-dependent oxidoreductase [Planctomycetaceae bacterium]
MKEQQSVATSWPRPRLVGTLSFISSGGTLERIHGSMKSIASKRALVTGAASGIGRAVANALARESAELYLLDIDQRRLEELAQELRSRGATVVARSCDLRDSDQLDACLDELLTDFRGVD